jgi:hypothetical protein
VAVFVRFYGLETEAFWRRGSGIGLDEGKRRGFEASMGGQCTELVVPMKKIDVNVKFLYDEPL